MKKDDKGITLPKGATERILSATLTLGMGSVMGISLISISMQKVDGIIEGILKIVGFEFILMIFVYCILVFIWCIFSPRWVPIFINKVMKNFMLVSLMMAVGGLILLAISLTLAVQQS